MVLGDGNGVPLATDVEATYHAEGNLIKPPIDSAVTAHALPRHIYDRAADSDPLQKRLAQRGIELVCTHREGRVRKKTQDGRKPRAYA